MADLRLDTTDKLSYNISFKTTKADVLYEQIRRSKKTTNQNQKLIKFLIEKVDKIEKCISNWFETEKSQPLFE